VAVTLVEKDGDKRLVRIIETEPTPQIERDEVAPSQSLALRLTGLRRGDEIELENFGTEPTRYVVTDLQSKYIYAHFRSLQKFETMFPESRAFGSFTIDEKDGDERFKPIFDSAKRKHEFTAKLVELYRSGTVPMALIATFSGSSPLSLWEFIRHHPEVNFQTAVGVAQEFAYAKTTLGSNRRGIVDPITLYGLVQLGIADQVKAAFQDLGVVQTSRDILRAYAKEQRDGRNRQQGSFGWDGTHYRLTEWTKEAVEENVSNAQAAVDFAESLTLVASEASSGITVEASDTFQDVDPAFLDSIRAAQGDGRVLLSDDRPLREFAFAAARIPTVWTQAVVKYAAEAGMIQPDSFLEVTAVLAESSHSFTMVGHQDFLHELRKTGWVVSDRITKFLDLMALPSNDQESVRTVLANLIFFGWFSAPSQEAFKVFFLRVFRALKAAQPGANSAELARHSFDAVERHIQARAHARHLRRRLLDSTSVTPVAVVIESLDRVAGRVAARIWALLSEAL
jgi:hypothetical protein